MGAHSYRNDLNQRGVHTIFRNERAIGVVSFLDPLPFEATVLRILCEALDDAEAQL